MTSDRECMERALALATHGLVRDGVVLGEGYHARAGEPHAEVHAVRAAGNDLSGATVYVTLEPCAHTGKTPPCVDLLLKHAPQRVVIAMEDPNPLVSGKSIARLREAGITVEVGLLEQQARRLNEAFIKFITTQRPFVIAKCAMTLDGKIATRTGHSRWVTGEAARRKVHELRNEVDAVLVGSRTVMFDDPSLTTRLDHEGTRDPIRIILDAEDYLDANRRVFNLDSDAPTWVVTTTDRNYACADEILRVPRGRGGADLRSLAEELGRRNITSLLIEGGGTTHASAFAAGIVDKVWFFVAPKIAGGKEALTPVEGEGAATMDEAIRLERMSVQRVGEDLLIEAYVTKSS